MTRFADEAAAQAAINDGDIDQYYLVPADLRESGEVILVSRDFNPFNVVSEDLFNYVINYALTDDAAAAAVYISPLFSVQGFDQAPIDPQAQDSSSPLAFFVPFAVMFVFFFLITMSSGYMLQSVSREKENRTAEILLVSLRPRELMLGKVLGLSLIALLQLGIWFGGGLVVLKQGQQLLETASTFTLPNGFIAWGVAFFALGYLLYASLMGAMGALAPNAREGGQFTFIIILPLIDPPLAQLCVYRIA